MQILKKDLKQKLVTIKINNPEDLWHLNKIIEIGDIVQGKTSRKIKLEKEIDRKSKIIKKIIFLRLEVEKQEFHEFSNNLRISGKILEGQEDLRKGSYHTFDLEENSIITVIKPHWLQYQLKILEDSTKKYTSKILICILDRSESCFALLQEKGYKYLSELEGEVEQKRYKTETKSNFYKQISKILQDYVKKYKIEHIIIGSPSFWKEYLIKELPKDLQKIVVQATCNNVGKQGINELLKRTELKKVLAQERTVKDLNLIEELLKNISKNHKSAYGIKEVQEKATIGAVKNLLITDKFIKKYRQTSKSQDLDSLFMSIEANKGDISIISSNQEPGKKLDSLSGIAAILRY